MSPPRSIVITGASRGLGFAAATLFHRRGWRVVAAMRSPEAGLARLQAETGAGPDDVRLIGVRLDLRDQESITAAAEAVTAAIGAPDVLVHNAGIAAAGSVEELPMSVWEEMFSTHVLGPVALTQALLPAMRAAGRGRIVVVSSQGGVRGLPCIAAYSAAKGAAERWAECMAGEIAPFGLGVTVLVTGTFDTEMITDATPDYRDFDGPYARHHSTIDRRGRAAVRLLAAPPARFAAALLKAADDTGPYRRHAVGVDARMWLLLNCFMPSPVVHQVTRLAMGLPRHGSLRAGGPPADVRTRVVSLLARTLPESVLNRALIVAARVFPPKPAPEVDAPAATTSAEPPSVKESHSMDDFDDLEDFGSFDAAVSGDTRDPYPEMARLRREEPVQRIDLSLMPHEESKPVFMVYRHEDVTRMLRDHETFSSSIVIDAFGEALGKHVMLGMDEPEHGRYRSLVAKAFSQKSLARWEEQLVGQVADDLIDRFAGRGSADLVKEFTFQYPTQIIAGLLGLPKEDYARFQKWSISLLSVTIDRERGVRASTTLRDYFIPILAARRADPRDDLISSLAQAEIDGERLTDEEIFSFLRLLLPAGVETTYRSLGNLLLALMSDPELLDRVRTDRSLLPQAIEEAVRWEPPLLIITRVATKDTELGGVPIPKGSSVMPMLGAANRQADRYENPDVYDIHRTARRHVAWGHGVHVCLGMHLARLEMRVAVNRLFDRLPNLRLDPEGDDPHIRGQVFRSPTSLPVLFDVPPA